MNPPVRQFLVAFLVSLLWVASTPSTHAAESELRVFPLKHRLADDVVPVVRPLLAPGESVSGMDARLIVRAAPQTFAQIERLLADIDTPRRNLRISVRHVGDSGPLPGGQGFSGNEQRGHTRIIVTNGDRSTNAPTGGQSEPDGGTQGSSERYTATKRDAATQTLMVLDGGRAFLRFGETITQVQPFLALAGSRLGAVAGIQYYDVTTGFEVEPRIVNEASVSKLVQLTVTPRLAFRSDQGAQTVNFQELRTQVLVKSGEWVDLGGAVELNSAVSRQILSTGSEGSRFLIRVDLL